MVKGAVLFGLNPNIIKMGKAKHIIGSNYDDIWNDAIHGGISEGYYEINYNFSKCRNSFHIFIKKGQNISQNDIII